MVDGRSVSIVLETSSFALDRRSKGRPKLTLSLGLCPDLMGIVVGHASFLFYFSQQFSPNSEGISAKNLKSR